ncbi:hypothetical protein PSU4_19060 [Pseudonocardia sulfidoxydans NBRC 16205]|uniref:UPF0232 protein PSU4_19060 n=1 Tax=Pseudonocardia sulfidoxydans NBRC 16205 TaxID=1223511 RepID=A0A511DDR5_9PSEU|nr:DciA family protein [Pseudonocardia sulfidoxydans]GEL22952.1 hypothetical protein PSU4_19060 [Pseudonocardia sulfidoxydans NBRC 16205]
MSDDNHSVPTPGDNENPAVRRGPGAGAGADGLRGPDLAREALRAAREASAQRASERAAAGEPRRRRAGTRGNRRRWSGPGPDDRDPQPFGKMLSRVSMDRGWSPRLTDATVLGRWPQLVGPDIADHCTPVSLRDGELTLQAESTAWATQLRTLQRQLLVRLAAAVGDGVVRRIRVVGPSAPSWRHGPRHVRGRGPRDTYG